MQQEYKKTAKRKTERSAAEPQGVVETEVML